MMSEKRFSNPFITKKVLQSKRVYDVHQNEPYFKLTKFHDLAQLVQYEINKRRASANINQAVEGGHGAGSQFLQMASEGSVGDRIDFDVLLANQIISSHEDENVIESNPGATSNMPQGTTN